MAKKQKFYVVWKGHKPRIYLNWEDCKAQIEQFSGALYKAFESRTLAEMAFKGKPHEYLKIDLPNELKPKQPITPSISVDGAWNTASLEIEYQCVDTATKRLLFRLGPYQEGTNNVAEFLGLVHALAYCKKNNLNVPVYSDSVTAISWVKRKKMNSQLVRSSENKVLFDLLERAEKWLHENTYTTKILKWETELWGENPADFGRK